MPRSHPPASDPQTQVACQTPESNARSQHAPRKRPSCSTSHWYNAGPACVEFGKPVFGYQTHLQTARLSSRGLSSVDWPMQERSLPIAHLASFHQSFHFLILSSIYSHSLCMMYDGLNHLTTGSLCCFRYVIRPFFVAQVCCANLIFKENYPARFTHQAERNCLWPCVCPRPLLNGFCPAINHHIA